VHPNDLMVVWGGPDRGPGYAHAGRSAVALVADSVERSGRQLADVERFLDVGCGYGRMIRYLVQHVDRERIWVTDVDRNAVDFCVDNFGVHGLHPPSALGGLDAPTFDMISVISVVTHLPEADGTALLDSVGKALNPGGLLLVTTHGRQSLSRIEAYGSWCAGPAGEIAAEFEDAGFSFRPYPHHGRGRYGLSWHSSDYVKALIARLHGDSLQLVDHLPHVLDGHQDAYLFVRSG
jgi:SAM-dependent methyltransferase